MRRAIAPPSAGDAERIRIITGEIPDYAAERVAESVLESVRAAYNVPEIRAAYEVWLRSYTGAAT